MRIVMKKLRRAILNLIVSTSVHFFSIRIPVTKQRAIVDINGQVSYRVYERKKMTQDTYIATNSRCASTTPLLNECAQAPNSTISTGITLFFSKHFIIRFLINRKYLLSHISYEFSEIFKVGLFVVSIHYIS